MTSDYRDSAAIHRLADEVLAVEHGALECAEQAARCDLAMIDRKAGHFGIRVDIGDVA